MSEPVTIPSSAGETEPPTGEPEPVVIRRNAMLLGLLGLGAAAIGVAYLVRAVSGGSFGDWLTAAALGVIAVPYVGMLASARSPLLVADETGVRIRLGGQWRGLRWEDMARVDVHSRAGFLRDGRVIIEPGEDEPVDEGLVGVGRLAATLNTRFHGTPLAISYGFTAAASRADMAAAFTELADGRVSVSEVGDTPVLIDDQGADSWAASSWGDVETESEQQDTPPAPDDVQPEPAQAEDPMRRAVHPARSTRPALRAEITKESERTPAVSVGALALSSPLAHSGSAPDLPEQTELRRQGASNVSLVAEGEAAGASGIEPTDEEPTQDLPAADEELAPDDSRGASVAIGRLVADGRAALGLSVDELAARTRIRPHVIESVERDDFLPCGGDFYARGHLRTFARVLGIDETELITTYNDEYATEPVSPRVVFEAELATGPTPTMRGTTGGPRWGTMITVVLLVLMTWGIVRLVVGGDHSPSNDPPVVNGSGGIASPGPVVTHGPRANVHLRAAYGDSRVVARSAGEVLFKGKLTAGTTKVIHADHTIHLTLSDAGAVLVTTNGTPRRTLGDPGERVTTEIRPHGGAGRPEQPSAR